MFSELNNSKQRMEEKIMRYSADIMKLANATAKANKGLIKVVINLSADNITDMKALLKENGYNFLVNNRAYRNVDDISPSNANYVEVKRIHNIYTATVVDFKRA